MSRKLLAFLLSELKIIRVICKNCGAVVEVPIEKLALNSVRAECQICGRDFGFGPDPDSAPRQLAMLLARFQNSKFHADIEFVLPDMGE